MTLKVRIDTSFIPPLLKYLREPNKDSFREVYKHVAAKRTYAHAKRFNNTKDNIQDFWKKILKRHVENSDALVERIKSALSYIYNEKDEFNNMISDLSEYSPEGMNISTNLYTIVGYDIGIVSEGAALIGIDHRLYLKDPTELLFMAMHELHHVIYTAYNPMYSFSDVQSTEQLTEMIRYSTHLEGLGVYVPYALRKSTDALTHDDYKIFQNKSLRMKRVSEYFDILAKYQAVSDRSLHDKDWRVLDQMTGKKRLWYIAGAHMAETIDKELGRDVLNQSIRLGSEAFFASYHKAI